MTYFEWGLILLFLLTTIFYIVFFSLSYYWHEKKISVVVVPLIYTFEFFIVGFFLVALLSIVLQNLPLIITLVNSGYSQ